MSHSNARPFGTGLSDGDVLQCCLPAATEIQFFFMFAEAKTFFQVMSLKY